jgi:hypothetical protein
MRRQSSSIEISASCEAVFDVVHDYERRLQWDTMLSQARLLAGARAAQVGVRSRCVGTWKSAFLALETEYVRFERGRVAAVRLTNRPPFFSRFAATIKHDALDAGSSRTTYIYSLRARPRFLAPLLEPLLRIMIAREVRGRLRALRDFVEWRAASGVTQRLNAPSTPG